MKPSYHSDQSKIEAYLDEVLAAAERDQFSREIATSGQLQDEIALQSRVDESLARLFAAPSPPRNLQMWHSEKVAPAVIPGRRGWMKVAALATAATIVWAMLAWHFFAN